MVLRGWCLFLLVDSTGLYLVSAGDDGPLGRAEVLVFLEAGTVRVEDDLEVEEAVAGPVHAVEALLAWQDEGQQANKQG